MNKEILTKNRAAGKLTYEQQVKSFKNTGKLINYIAGHYIVMANAYDYVKFCLPEKPLKDWKLFLEFGAKPSKESINKAKTMALENFLKM